MTIKEFQITMLSWYQKNRRDFLPWRQPEVLRDPYKILVSEIMLQQTQVSRVLEKYPKFLAAFPSLEDLARAPFPRVLGMWQGLGYNRRARSFYALSQLVMAQYRGNIPRDSSILQTLPGIGPYSAGALACFAFNKPVAFLDTNIRKVFLHFFFMERNEKIAEKDFLEIARKALYRKNPRKWHYALMDYGANVLRNEKGILQRVKVYHKQSPFLGSTRYFRSKIVRHLLTHKQASNADLQDLVAKKPDAILTSLMRDGLIQKTPLGFYQICDTISSCTSELTRQEGDPSLGLW